ncbi:DUF4338 domain-containing protein [Candidatus Pelagibacter sp.]|nr:DUF4338 domain-containing protein [Candidatus Pelagibacter sp.]
MSEITPDIRSEDLNFIKDKVIESKEDSSFDLVSELRLKSEQPGTTTDSLKFKTFCSLLADLVDLGWSIEITRKGFEISPPKYVKSDEAKIKARNSNWRAAENDIRNLQDVTFINKLRKPPVGSKNKSIDLLVDNGDELKKLFEEVNSLKDENEKVEALKKIIKPEIQHCFLDETCSFTGLRLMDVWRYFRLTWSMPYQTSNARTMPFLVRNGARPNKPIIGIFQLVNPFFNNTGRNSFLRWDNYLSAVQEIKNKNLTVEELADAFLQSIHKSIKETRFDDLIDDHNLIKKPTQKVISKLTDLAEQYRIEENEEEKIQFKKIKIKTRREVETPLTKSSEKMYLKKRSKRLSKLLFARMIFNEYNLKKNPKKAITIMLQIKDGQRAMNIALEYIRQGIYSTQAADLNVCGSIAPYNELLGGKLVTLLSTSKNVMEKYDENYKKEKSIISSAVAGRDIIKPSKLLFLTVSSLYDIASSQYNRLKLYQKDYPKLKTDLIFHEAGFTEGIGSYHISQKTSDLMNDLTGKVKKYEKKSISGKGHSHKIRKIIIGLRILNLKQEHIMMHNQKRRNYVFFHKNKKNIIKYLYGLKKIENFNHCSPDLSITDAWIKRWVIKRIQRKESLEKIGDANYKTVSSLFENVVKEFPFDKDKNLNLFSNISN